MDRRKFDDPLVTAGGERRAQVALRALETLWFNTGTLCNLTCGHCYIESSPKNDRLVYLTAAEVAEYLDEIGAEGLPTRMIGFTGGEPFMNPELPAMLDDALSRGFDALVLTNAMKPMAKCKPALRRLNERYGDRLTIRVSVDHYGAAVHEEERGRRSWKPTIDGLCWLARNGFSLHVASRRLSGESEAEIRSGFARLFGELGIDIDAADPVRLMVFPEMEPPPMFPKSPRRAGAFSANRRRASCAPPRGWSSNARGRRGRRSSPAHCCPTTSASNSARPLPRRAVPCRSIIRIAPNSACSAAGPAAAAKTGRCKEGLEPGAPPFRDGLRAPGELSHQVHAALLVNCR